MKVPADAIRVRAMKPETDLNFILSTWLKSYRNSPVSTSIPNILYFESHQAVIAGILRDPSTMVTVLCSPEDEDSIIGYVVHSNVVNLIHYMYVKVSFRKFGIGEFMLNGVRAAVGQPGPMFCTHVARKWNKKSKLFDVVYDPYILGGYVAQIGNQPENQQPSSDAPVV